MSSSAAAVVVSDGVVSDSAQALCRNNLGAEWDENTPSSSPNLAMARQLPCQHSPTPLTPDNSTRNISLSLLSTESSSGTLSSGTRSAEQTGQNRVESCLQGTTDFVVSGMEGCFYRFGSFVGRHPVVTLCSSFVVFGLCLVGILRHSVEMREEKLWLDQDSPLIGRQEWVAKHFPLKMRYVNLIALDAADDVLTSRGLLALLELDRVVKSVFSNSSNPRLHWQEICYSVDAQGKLCLEHSLLELWGYNEHVIRGLSKDDIVRKVNDPNLKSSITHQNVTMSNLLGRSTGNSTHAYIRARASKMAYFLRKEGRLNVVTGYVEDSNGEAWEEEFAGVIRNNYSQKRVLFSTYTSFLNAGLQAVQADIPLLVAGYVLIVCYLVAMLGKFTQLEQKVWLGFVTILIVGLSLGSAYGLSAACGLKYTKIHEILPFLILGIGVDDVFVIVQTFENVGPTDETEPIHLRIARTMQHSGIAITVTSLTDFLAFVIGASTVLPALRSFCVYAGLGIIFLFFFSCTTFMSCLALDAKRQRRRRDACCPLCIELPDGYQPYSCSQKSRLKAFIGDYCTRYLFTVAAKVLVIVFTLALFCVGMYGAYMMEQRSLFESFMSPGSEEVHYQTTEKELFLPTGNHMAAYVGEVDYFREGNKLDQLVHNLRAEKYIERTSVLSWYEDFVAWTERNNIQDWKSNETRFYESTEQFLYQSSEGRQHSSDVIIKNGRIVVTRYRGKHTLVKGREQEMAAMDNAQAACSKITFESGFEPFALAFIYTQWETDIIIKFQVIRNLSLAAGMVLLVTLFLITNLIASLLVLVSVVFTITDLLGFLYFWDVGIDGVLSIIVVVALGFSVDYSAHIGYAFMASRRGDKNVRARNALVEIGPAVFNGGLSTFLAFLFLVGSQSPPFQIFFKVFCFVVLFGLFHGMVFLPVILSLLGPKAYSHLTVSESSKDEQKIVEDRPNISKRYSMHEIGYDNEFRDGTNSTTRVMYNRNAAITDADNVALPDDRHRVVDDIVYIIAYNAPTEALGDAQAGANILHVRAMNHPTGSSGADSGIDDGATPTPLDMTDSTGKVYALRMDSGEGGNLAVNLSGERLAAHARLEVVNSSNAESKSISIGANENEHSNGSESADYMYALRLKIMELLPNVNIM